jgi:serine/threonine kinase 32
LTDSRLGGDLRFHINRKTFSEEAVRFWIAEVACALRYLHSRGIIHRFVSFKKVAYDRDIKPDNILLDSEGHAHLADFNVATYLQPNRKLTGRSGTAAYMGMFMTYYVNDSTGGIQWCWLSNITRLVFTRSDFL